MMKNIYMTLIFEISSHFFNTFFNSSLYTTLYFWVESSLAMIK